MKNRPIHALLVPALSLAFALSSAFAEDWKRVSSKDGKISALFPENIADNPQTQVDKTAAGKVTSYFGEFYGDGYMVAGSGADIPMLARAAGQGRVFDASKKTFLDQAQGSEISFKETTVGGAPARELIYKGDAYQGKGDPYEARALFIMVDKRMYVINAVITDKNATTEAAAKKLFDSIQVSE